jgi:hypothetical protein
MRSLVLIALLALPAHAQVVGWVACENLRTDEKITFVKIALMDGNLERRSAVRAFDTLKPGMNEIAFSKLTGPAEITGMRIHCTIVTNPATGVASEAGQYTLNWAKTLQVPTGVTASPKIGVSLTELAPARWRASVGQVP